MRLLALALVLAACGNDGTPAAPCEPCPPCADGVDVELRRAVAVLLVDEESDGLTIEAIGDGADVLVVGGADCDLRASEFARLAEDFILAYRPLLLRAGFTTVKVEDECGRVATARLAE